MKAAGTATGACECAGRRPDYPTINESMMKTLTRYITGAGFLGCLFFPTLHGQTKPAPSPDNAETASDTVELSPFEINAGTDEGYAARETLAGTRFKSDLKDVSSQVSIMTKEFLDDIASVNVDDAFRYSANIENTSEFMSATNAGGDFNTGVLNTRVAGRIRGLTSPGNTHDFFQTDVMQDTYNTERVSILSGPNAILFGNGNPGGIVDTSFIRANVQRAKYETSFRTDNYGSLRASIDLNQPLIKDTLALRFASEQADQNSWRHGAGRKDERYFGTVSLKPTKSTTIRFYYEDAEIDQTIARNVRFGDQVTPWIEAGRPAFDNGLTNPTLVSSANNSYFARNTTTRSVWILGAAVEDPYLVWGSGNAVNVNLASTKYSGVTIGPGSAPNQSGVDAHIYSLPYDESISPFNVSVNGNGTRNLTFGKIWGASFEQRLPAGLFLQLDYNHESIVQPISDFVRGIQSAVLADANLYLPDRVTPNPNYGRYYVEGQPRVFAYRSEKQDARAQLSYEIDFTRHANWTKWLGRHRLAAMYLRSESFGAQQEFAPRAVPAGLSDATVLDNWGSGKYNTLAIRAYLSDPTDASTGHTYSLELPFDPLRTVSYTLPDGSSYVAGYQNPYGATGAGNMVNSLVQSQVLAVQSFFWKNRIVANFGWRHDATKQATRALGRKTTSTSAYESIFDYDPPRDWSEFSSGNTSTQGVVVHVMPWLSAFYNQSSTWNPPTALINPDDGTIVPGSTGDGKDYGIMLTMFNDRLSLRLNRYDNTSGPDSNNTYRNAIVPVVQNIEQTLLARTQDGTVNVPPAEFYDASQGTYTYSGLQSDFDSHGYEAEIVFNPTPNWRMALNGSKSESVASNIGKPWINFIEQRSPVWAANSTLTDPDATSNTIATYYLQLIQVLNQMAQADGQKVESGRDWRANFLTRYSFDSGALKGAFIGAGYRWRSPQVIGYRSVLVDNAFPLPGAPAQVLVPARDQPIKGSAITETELFLGYSRKIGRHVHWRAQLNVRNLFDDQDPVAQRANLEFGYTSVYSVPEPRSFIFTNTFTF